MSELYLPAGAAAGGPYDLEITPESAGWGYSSLRVIDPGGRRRAPVLPAGARRSSWCRCPAARRVTVGRRDLRAGRAGRRVRRADRHRLPAGRVTAVDADHHRRWPVRPLRAPTSEPRLPAHSAAAEVPVELRGAGQSQPPGPQLRHAGRAGRRCDHRLRGDHAGRQLVVLPGAQARRDAPRPSRSWRRSTTSRSPPARTASRAWASCAPRPRPATTSTSAKRSTTVTRCWCRTAGTARASAAPGYDMYYLNVMAGPGAGAGLEDHRPPRPDLGAEHLGRPAGRPPPDPRGLLIMGETLHLTVAQATVKFLSQQYRESDGVEQQVLRRLLRHLRSRQRGRSGPGAAAGRDRRAGRAAVRAGSQRAGHGAHRGRLRPDAEPAADVRGLQRRRSRAPPTWSPGRRWPPSTGSRCCCCRPTRSPTARASPLLQELELPYAGDVTVNDAFRPVSQVLRPGLAARAAAGRAARRDAGAHRPGRDRCGHRLLPAGRAGAGVRLAGRAVRQAGLARLPAAAGDRGDRPRRRRSSARRSGR